MALYALKTVLRLRFYTAVPFMTICLSKSTHIYVESEALEITTTFKLYSQSRNLPDESEIFHFNM